MRVRINRIVHPWKSAWSWTLLAGVLGFWGAARILAPAAGGAPLRGIRLPACPLRTWTGIPCPLCGITTGCVWMAHGRLWEAWHSNILSPLLMIASLGLGLYVVAVRMAAGRSVELDPVGGARRTLWIVAGSAFAASWIANLSR